MLANSRRLHHNSCTLLPRSYKIRALHFTEGWQSGWMQQSWKLPTHQAFVGSNPTPSATYLKPALIERALFCLDLPVFKQYRRVFSYSPEFAKLHKSMPIAIQLKNQKVGQYGKTERILRVRMIPTRASTGQPTLLFFVIRLFLCRLHSYRGFEFLPFLQNSWACIWIA